MRDRLILQICRKTGKCQRRPNRFWHLQETSLSLSEEFEVHCRKQPTSKADRKGKPNWRKKITIWWCTQMARKARDACDNKKSTVDHLEKERHRKSQWSTIYIQSTADRTTANRTSQLLPVQHYRQSETRGGAHVDFSRPLHSVLNWCELTEIHRAASFR